MIIFKFWLPRFACDVYILALQILSVTCTYIPGCGGFFTLMCAKFYESGLPVVCTSISSCQGCHQMCIIYMYYVW